MTGLCFEANAPHKEVAENILYHQFEFEASGPLGREALPTKQVLDATYSLNVVFSSETSAYRFTGKPYSSSTGLYYEYQRWYDPSAGRFISPDPYPGELSNAQSQNGYVYATNDPATLTDPTGLVVHIGNCIDSCGWSEADSIAAAAFVAMSLDAHHYSGIGGSGTLSAYSFTRRLLMCTTCEALGGLALANAYIAYRARDTYAKDCEITSCKIPPSPNPSCPELNTCPSPNPNLGSNGNDPGWTPANPPFPIQDETRISIDMPDSGISLPGKWPPMPNKPLGPVYVPPQNIRKRDVARICALVAGVYGLIVVGAFSATAEKEKNTLGPLVSGAILSGATAPMVFAACYFLL